MNTQTNFQKSFFYFLFFIFLAFAAGCRSSQTREEVCTGLPAKSQAVQVAQVEQPVQKNVVANQGETATHKNQGTKQEVKAVPPQKKTEVAQAPVEKKAPTTTQQPSQAKNLLAQIQSKLAEVKKVEPGERRRQILGEVKNLGNEIHALAKGGDAEAITVRNGTPYQDAAKLYKQLRDEKVAGQLVVRPEEKVSPTPKSEGEPTTPQMPTVPKDRKVPGSSGMPTWLWMALGLLVACCICGCAVNRVCKKKRDARAKAQEGQDETAEEPVTADEKTQLGGGAPAAAVVENPTETPKKEEGRPEETPAVEKKQAQLPEAEWQKLLAGIRKAGTEYPAGNPSLRRALEEAKAAEEAFGAACDELAAARKKPEAVRHELAARKVAAAVKKAERWLFYWQEASKEVVEECDLKIYCQAKLEKATRDLAKAKLDQQRFAEKPTPPQKKGGNKKCGGKKK